MMARLLPCWSFRKAGFSRANTRCRLKIGLGRDKVHMGEVRPTSMLLTLILYHYPTFFCVYIYRLLGDY